MGGDRRCLQALSCPFEHVPFDSVYGRINIKIDDDFSVGKGYAWRLYLNDFSPHDTWLYRKP